MNCTIRSLYLCVKDMDRAIRFYESFLEQPVTGRDDLYSVFDVNGDSGWGSSLMKKREKTIPTGVTACPAWKWTAWIF